MSENCERQTSRVELSDDGGREDQQGTILVAEGSTCTGSHNTSGICQNDSELSGSGKSTETKRKRSLKFLRRHSKSTDRFLTKDESSAGACNGGSCQETSSSNDHDDLEMRGQSDSMMNKLRKILKKERRKPSLSKTYKRGTDCNSGHDKEEEPASFSQVSEGGNSILDEGLNPESESSPCLGDATGDVRSAEVSEGAVFDHDGCCCLCHCGGKSMNVSPHEEASAPRTPYSILDINPDFSFDVDDQAVCQAGDHQENAEGSTVSENVEQSGDCETDNNIQSFFKSCWKEIRRSGWYWGPLTLQETKDIMYNRPQGSFLVRDSSNDMYILSLSYQTHDRDTRHVRIQYNNGYFSLSTREKCHSVKELIECYQSNSLNFYSARNMRPFQLLHPVMRSEVVPSLKYLCRLVIRWNVWTEDIDELPLPKLILMYLKKRNYFIED